MTADSLADLSHALLDRARAAGADAADVLTVRSVSVSVDVRNGTLEQAERADGVEAGLRVLVGRRQACVATSDIRPESLTALADRAVAMARIAPEDDSLGLADPDAIARDWDVEALDLVDPGAEPDPGALEQAAREAEAAAMAVEGITQMDASSAAYGRQEVHLAATNGFSGGYARTDHVLSAVAISGSGLGMERDYDYDSRLHREDLRSAEEIGRRAGERAVERQGARKPPTGAVPVLFDERVASSLIGHLTQAVNGRAIVRGSSWLRDALGEKVLPDGMSLTEEPHRARTAGSRPFDAEGLATARRDIVADGVLTGWTLDLGSGRRLGLPSTANATRGPSSPPSPGLSNLRLTQGDRDRAALMREMGRGLLVTSLIGSSVNPTTGDYSRGASGFWIENGEIAYPVNECTIAGNLRQMLRGLVPANDARAHLSRVVPSLLVDGLTVAGS